MTVDARDAIESGPGFSLTNHIHILFIFRRLSLFPGGDNTHAGGLTLTSGVSKKCN